LRRMTFCREICAFVNIRVRNKAVFERCGKNCEVKAIERTFATLVRLEIEPESTRGNIERDLFRTECFTKQTLCVPVVFAVNGTDRSCEPDADSYHCCY